ncbi:TetR family transcriptional regulator [Actinomycetospora cinnamomea]|uniref:TetR family transcriptional regulator n=1 Tax=Actinomycetospora cinnamomea TaxID=663609 RepID=A0A2U1F439_9PSEU|nr:TetR family transcriptional regulator [Actinomycetospora cinnamomea]PVZ06936.1 TetR family transcriptional regulator [Actinomycetospora cinnamomea]
MSNPYRDEAHQRMREAALDAAADEVLARGWRGLQMQTVATRTGVSRQTLYKTFGDKHGLSQALVLRHAHQLLEQVAAAMADRTTLRGRWAAAVQTTLAAAEGDPLVKAVLLSDSSDEFLPLITTRGAPVLELARRGLTALVTDHHPDLDPDRVETAADAAARMTLSHLVLPQQPVEETAADIAEIVTRYLERGA